MRIVVVSSHYPPDFVSGGTLVAQRTARGFHRRGHDTSVFAGWLGLGSDDPRPALTAWEEVDETGLPVRWVKVSPFIGWSDRRNFDNPEVAAAFAEHLADRRPDVVHLHSLQAMGGSLVTAAAAAGARVVVTMHDFWWLCARQFLVDRDHHPCCLVVDAGTCACEVDRAWLTDRAHVLRPSLAAADLVLAPSEVAAAVLAANGVDPGRLRVDENGLPGTVAAGVAVAGPRRPGSAPGPVRFRYAGGWNPMKGARVLAEAARLLAEEQPEGWRLVTHGLVEAGHEAPSLPPPVELADPYDPDELGAVLAATDVLVLPSVMRETHSILTREALAAGVPVLTTDSLGPEEVVDDGRNGLVVPADDASSLAAAMARIVADPALLGRLRAGCEPPPEIRALDDQVDGLLVTFEELLAARPEAAPAPIRSVVWMAGIDGAPLRYRAHLPAEALRLHGVATEVLHYRDRRLPAAIAGADVLVVYRVPATRQVLELIDGARRAGTPVVFDVDDLIFDPAIAAEIPALRILEAEEAALWLQGVRRYRRTMEACDGYVGSTAMLVEHAASVVGMPAARFDNGVGLVVGRRSDEARSRPRAPGPLRIGYLSGTTTHDEDWRYVEPAVADVLATHPDVELWLGGHLPDSELDARFEGRVRRIPFTDWRELPEVLRDLDVNLAPLAPGGRFNEAKSAIKWLEAALVATPTVASPTGPFADAVTDGANGFLPGDLDGWRVAIGALLDDPLMRERIGARARRDALLRWSPHLQATRYLGILRGASAWARLDRPRPTGTVDFDEPLVADAAFAPYGGESVGEPVAPAVSVGPAATPRWRRLAAGARRSLRDDGAAVTARRAAGRALRALRRR